MSSRRESKPKKSGLSNSKAVNSPSSSTTSSSKQFPEISIDGQSSPASSSARSKPQYIYSDNLHADADRSKENVTVTVRPRELRQGEEIAWYADGEAIVRNEHNQTTAYAYDRVFGPTTTTRQVYDVAAQHVVSGAMEGINGTIFAYGMTSSGKTHTMHGDQRSPGIIPLAVKDAFSIIQETPSREFLLRVSYLEIYNEVVNDLLNPAGQNLRIREDAQGTFVEGIKEEVVLSPAHALSLIAAGEEHRHVGSTNFNLLSSRSHTIFTLTIESSPYGENSEGEAVNLSQLNLIDLAGSESSKVETTGIRRKEGSYINKSLLTLGTVISKLTDGRATHIPYRDSKLTRLLQSSLSGHGRIIDEKSLIKKYQNEICALKEELEQLKRGILTIPQLHDIGEDDIILLKQKLEDGQVKLQSRLEQEEEAKAALLSRIQRLTKLILVSTNASQSSRLPQRPGPRRRHSFGEEELAYLPHRRRDMTLDGENVELYVSLEGNAETGCDTLKEEKKARKNGLLNWLKHRKRDSGMESMMSASDKSSGNKSNSTPSTPKSGSKKFNVESRLSQSLFTESSPCMDLLSDARRHREVPENDYLGQETPLTSLKAVDQIDLLREQQKILSGEVALHSSTLKRLSEEAARNPQNEQIHDKMKRISDEIRGKNERIALLGKQIADSIMVSSNMEKSEISQSTVAELVAQLNEKSFELEVKAADNRIIQEQLNLKICECEGLQETVASLKQQLSDALESPNVRSKASYSQQFKMNGLQMDKEVAAPKEISRDLLIKTQGLASAAAVELKELSEEVAKLMNQNERLMAELAAAKNPPTQRRTSTLRNGRRESLTKQHDQGGSSSYLKRELAMSKERELSYEAALLEKNQREAELQRKVEESKQREAYLENELANMWRDEER
ncbi:hypothetical protein CXB51_023455 [Gossypium anomalum]|uniref:Kinesin-like protein n=1 Tax=Gossypium anomalum TaxID=47600 RepID=A0A8J6CXL9_9ROSI|nr:hypothetical protein CXB51_023455 [Gossypium anomalum]